MASKLLFHPQVNTELLDALKYYHEISPELSEDLLNKFQDSINLIFARPKLNPLIKRKYRKVNLERFPYKVIFSLDDDVIKILAFTHHKRKPSYWKGRS